MKTLILVFCGGGLGSICRYLISLGIPSTKPSPYIFPWSTFIVNILGCFLIGLFISLHQKAILSSDMKLFLVIGFCGGFTTFSTFSNEVLMLLKNQNWEILLAYITFSLLIGVAATAFGYYLTLK